MHQIHVSLENGLKYEKEVTKVIRKDIEQDVNTGSDYKVIYNDLNKNIKIKVSSDAKKVSSWIRMMLRLQDLILTRQKMVE